MKNDFLTTKEIKNLLIMMELEDLYNNPTYVDAREEVYAFLEELGREEYRIGTGSLLEAIKQIKNDYKRPEVSDNKYFLN